MKRVDLPMAFFRVSNVISSAGVLCRPEQESMLNIFVQGTFEGTGYKVVKSFSHLFLLWAISGLNLHLK